MSIPPLLEPLAEHGAEPSTLVEKVSDWALWAAWRSGIRVIKLIPEGLAEQLTRPVAKRNANGERLDPQINLVHLWQTLGLFLDGGRASGMDGQEEAALTPASARRASVLAGAPLEALRPEVRSVRSLEVPGAEGPIAARHYVPLSGGEGRPAVMFVHGGGFVVGDLDGADGMSRFLANVCDVHVVSVDYRLAPEHPFPAGLNDTAAAWRWLAENAQTLGADPNRLAISGDSAGGALATISTWQSVTSGERAPDAQLLLYPVADLVMDDSYKSRVECANVFPLHLSQMTWGVGQYIGNADRAQPLASAVRIPDLKGMPATVLAVGAFDLLHDEGMAYAERLREAGTHLELLRFPNLSHGFGDLTGISAASVEALTACAKALTTLLDFPEQTVEPAST